MNDRSPVCRSAHSSEYHIFPALPQRSICLLCLDYCGKIFASRLQTFSLNKSVIICQDMKWNFFKKIRQGAMSCLVSL